MRDQTKSGEHHDYSIIRNTGKSLGNLRRLAVTQPPVKDHLPYIRNQLYPSEIDKT